MLRARVKKLHSSGSLAFHRNWKGHLAKAWKSRRRVMEMVVEREVEARSGRTSCAKTKVFLSFSECIRKLLEGFI